jgi:hypothetical protein
MKKSYKFIIKVRDEENTNQTKFKPDMDVGVLYEAILDFKIPKHKISSWEQLKDYTLCNQGHELLNKIFEVKWEETNE